MFEFIVKIATKMLIPPTSKSEEPKEQSVISWMLPKQAKLVTFE
jgi:hypothetical protein